MNIKKLQTLVMEGDLGCLEFGREAIADKLEQCTDLYVVGGFSFHEAVNTEHPLLVYRKAHNALVRDQNGKDVPSTPDHLYEALRTSDVPALVRTRVNASQLRQEPAYPDQCNWDLNVYKDAFHLDITQGYLFRRECWLQAGNRQSPGHLDHGRVLSYIPPGLERTFKIWVAFRTFNAAKEFSFGSDAKDFDRMLAHEDTVVVVQRPGDVVYISPLIYHSVLLGYTKGTPPPQRWGLIDGYVFILRRDKLHAYTYATQANTGSRKGSHTAWVRVLGAFCEMEGRVLQHERIQDEIEAFSAQVMAENPVFAKRSRAGACSRHKGKKRKASIAHARSFKKRSAKDS